MPSLVKVMKTVPKIFAKTPAKSSHKTATISQISPKKMAEVTPRNSGKTTKSAEILPKKSLKLSVNSNEPARNVQVIPKKLAGSPHHEHSSPKKTVASKTRLNKR